LRQVDSRPLPFKRPEALQKEVCYLDMVSM
jgi:hypothetical protein